MKKIMCSRCLLLIITGLFLLLTTACSSKESNSTAKEEKNEQGKKITMIFSFKSANLDPHTNFTPIRAGITETLLKLDVLIHGELDLHVPVELSKNYYKCAVDKGENVKIVILPDIDQFKIIEPTSSAWASVINSV
jgi:hypothetical protein